jgi:predicted O-methyltransferase YrrM
LYNKDYHRIILNTRVRLEKDPYNLDIHKFMTCSKIELFNQATGNQFGKDSNSYKTLIGLCKQRNPKKVLDIGFGASTLLFLEHSYAYVTSVDIKGFNTDYLQKEYKDRLTFIKGNSIDVIPTLTDIFDLIYIDGSKEYSNVLADLVNCYYKSTAETMVIVNGVVRMYFRKAVEIIS